jgi:hypothetical protein
MLLELEGDSQWYKQEISEFLTYMGSDYEQFLLQAIWTVLLNEIHIPYRKLQKKLTGPQAE